MNNFFRNSTVMIPLSYFSLLYIKAMLHSFDEHQKHLEKIEKENIQFSKTSGFERFKKAYHPLFPLSPQHKIIHQDTPKPKM
jgi:hypothetical protein